MKGAITHTELKTMPIAERNWYIDRLRKQFEEERRQQSGDTKAPDDRPLSERDKDAVRRATDGLMGGGRQ